MTKPDYSDIVKKNEAVMKFRKFGKSPNGKIKITFMKNAVIMKTSEKGFMVNKTALPVKMTVRNDFTERKNLKKQAKRDLKAYRDKNTIEPYKNTIEPLFYKTFEQSMNNNANSQSPYWVGIELYWAGYARGIREQRQNVREKQGHRDNIGALTGNDIADLAQALSIDINKLNTAVLELTASRKQVVHEI
ncbi:hypothetical protein ACL43R_02605 [Lactococcus formosensis]|uniref:hypothetical protein n=1 Tax=Lactococcus formosensis TaxID=1281486 RepID=UPI0039F665C5